MTQKVAVYSISELKNTTDDALPAFLKGRKKFAQNHVLSDVRMGLGYTAVLIAATTFYLDYKRSWSETKTWTQWAVALYFVLNGALTLWIWAVEKGKIFTGSKGNLLVSFASHVEKHEPVYHLKVRYSDPADPAGLEGHTLELESSFTKWFTADGLFVSDNFHLWLSSVVPFLSDKDKEGDQRKRRQG